MSVIKRGEKEQKLGGFLRTHFACEALAAKSHEVLLIARSFESPVAKALAGHAAQIAATRRPVRMILARADRGEMPVGWPLADGVQVDCEIRWARNPRLLEAHEQLVLSSATCWIGDSMRRDPAKCDAYETFAESNSEAATAARVSFERLWAVSQPLFPNVLIPAQVTAPSREFLR
jgi:hypothetical protein